jgi:PAS domain S-box-containing protein
MIRKDLKLLHKALILVSVPLLFEVVFVVTLAYMLHQAEEETQREVRARAIVHYVERINLNLVDAGEAATGYSMSESFVLLNQFEDAVKTIPDDFRALLELTSSDKADLNTVNQCRTIVEGLVTNLSGSISAFKNGNQLVGLRKLDGWKLSQRSFRTKASEIFSRQEAILKRSPKARKEAREGIVHVLEAGLVFNIFLALGLVGYFHRGTSSRLNVLMENTERLSKQEPLKPELEGNDEIARLDSVFHRMSEALAEAARKERAIVDNAQDVICALDGKGRFVRVSPASTKIFGYQPDELIGKTIGDLLLQPDSVDKLTDVRRSLGGERLENRVRRKDGEIIHVLWSAFWSPSEQAMFCVAHDISERKRAEEELRASEARVRQIIDSMPVGLFIIDDDGIVEMVNPAALELFRYSADELIDRHIMGVFPTVKSAQPYAFMDALFEDALGRITEREGVRKDGTTFMMELSLKAYLAREGRRYLTIVLDVTKRHEIDQLKQSFFAMVSHDLRSPLTSIEAFLMMLLEGVYGQVSPEATNAATHADRSARRLLDLVNDLLDLDKLESGRFDMEFADIAISSVIEHSLDAVRTIAEKQGNVVETPVNDEMVHADGDRLVQVLVNLLGNAIKYSPQGAPIVISVNRSAESVEVRVTDKGRGVPAHLRQSIFERFKQVDVQDRKQKGGSGLGLAIAKALIEQHGGSIGVDSKEGEGSSFWFRVPPAKADAGIPLKDSAPLRKDPLHER